MNERNEVVNNIDVVIEGMTLDLKRYVNKGKASKYVVDKNNGYIKNLTKARNFIATLMNSVDFHIVMALLQDITKLERRDPELNGHIIKLCKREGNRFGYLTKCY